MKILINHKRRIVSIFLSVSLLIPIYGQSQTDLEKIAASQGTASPLVYTTANKDIPIIKPGAFYNEKECTPRSGFPNFYARIENKENITIAFIGGSITQGEYCYRLQTTKYIESIYPHIHFKWINAGVSGTDTDLGAFRIQEQVLQYKPDLVFIEFAVNGGYPDGMEGMIRKIIKENPHTDICLIYTISTKQTAIYQKGEIPQVIQVLDNIATHYQLPSIHMGMEAAELEQENKLLWKGTNEEAQGRILFSNDGVHPITEGGNLYASAIARALEKTKKGKSTPFAHTLPLPLISNKWEAADMYLPSQIASFDNNWKEIQTHENAHLNKFNGWFNTIMTSGKEGASFTFRFEGDMFGLFDIGGPEVGLIDILVDGTENHTLNRFNTYCNNRYRGQYDVIQLKEGIHEVIIRISSQKADKKTILGKGKQDDITEHPEKYDQSVVYLGRILLRGKPLQEQPKLTQQQKWEQKINRYEELDAANPPGKDIILFVGSSTVEGWKSLQTDFPEEQIVNRGVSGTKTIDLFNYKERLIFPYQPKQIFIYEGDNDIGYKWTPERILSQFKELFFAIRKEKPKAEIIFISIKPSPRRLKDKVQVEQTNALIKAFVEKQKNAAYADVYTAMHTPEGELFPEHYKEDGLHLTTKGYEVWKEVISPLINNK